MILNADKWRRFHRIIILVSIVLLAYGYREYRHSPFAVTLQSEVLKAVDFTCGIEGDSVSNKLSECVTKPKEIQEVAYEWQDTTAVYFTCSAKEKESTLQLYREMDGNIQDWRVECGREGQESTAALVFAKGQSNVLLFKYWFIASDGITDTSVTMRAHTWHYEHLVYRIIRLGLVGLALAALLFLLLTTCCRKNKDQPALMPTIKLNGFLLLTQLAPLLSPAQKTSEWIGLLSILLESVYPAFFAYFLLIITPSVAMEISTHPTRYSNCWKKLYLMASLGVQTFALYFGYRPIESEGRFGFAVLTPFELSRLGLQLMCSVYCSIWIIPICRKWMIIEKRYKNLVTSTLLLLAMVNLYNMLPLSYFILYPKLNMVRLACYALVSIAASLLFSQRKAEPIEKINFEKSNPFKNYRWNVEEVVNKKVDEEKILASPGAKEKKRFVNLQGEHGSEEREGAGYGSGDVPDEISYEMESYEA